MKAGRILLGLLGLAAAIQLAAADKPKITALERSQGWRLIFDGESLRDWRGYQLNKVPANWTVADDWATNHGGPGLVSEEDFQDFELQFDWKVAEGGTAQVYLRVDEDGTGPEETGLLVELAGGTAMGGNGGLTKLWREITPQPGLWYRARITVYGNLVEHWINGDRVLTCLVGSPEWRTAVAGSRFKAFRDYGQLRRGRIVLAGSGASFRSIKIRTY